jgi:hypothetical protein
MTHKGIALLVACAAAVASSLSLAGPASAAPASPIFGAQIDSYASYDGQDTCDPAAKPGVTAFKNLLNQTYGSHNAGIGRECHIGGASEHKEGRALDYGFNYNNTTDRAQATELIDWLLATDAYGNEHAMARRLGLMYIIWNKQQWRAYNNPDVWTSYSGASDHTDHIHFSFSWAGANQQTSWWSGQQLHNFAGAQRGDFNADGKDDIMIFRPSNGTWYARYTGIDPNNGGQAILSTNWGEPGDIPLLGDFNADGKSDIMIFRPSTGLWVTRYTGIDPNSGGQLTLSASWGGAGDIPLTGDFNADGKDDIMIFRPSNGTWYARYTGLDPNNGGQAILSTNWGGAGDWPLAGDFNADGKADIAIFRPSNGTWYVRYTGLDPNSGGQAILSTSWGEPGDFPMHGDFNADGKDDIMIFRPSTGLWVTRYTGIDPNSGGQLTLSAAWGGISDWPMAGDYNADGKADILIFRPSNGTWYTRYTGIDPNNGGQAILSANWGGPGDIPL